MGAWKLESAKARLSELVRQAKDEGPQTITVRGRRAVVVVSADQFERLVRQGADENWVDRFRGAFLGDIDLDRDDDRGRDLVL